MREERRLRVFECRVLRRIFGPKRDEVAGDWRKLHNEDLNDKYSLPYIVRVIKSRRMRWGGACSTYGGKWRWGKLRERDHLEEPGIDGRLILRWIFRNWNVREGTGLIWFSVGTGCGQL
jgi:hypothetical protein